MFKKKKELEPIVCDLEYNLYLKIPLNEERNGYQDVLIGGVHGGTYRGGGKSAGGRFGEIPLDKIVQIKRCHFFNLFNSIKLKLDIEDVLVKKSFKKLRLDKENPDNKGARKIVRYIKKWMKEHSGKVVE